MLPRLLAIALSASLPAAALAAPSGRAVLRNASGEEVATATFKSSKGGVRVKVTAKSKFLTPGKHGVHIHAVGKCETPGFTSAGPHFNPEGKKHGLQSQAGAHAGDLPNLVVNAKGKGKLSFLAKGATLGDGTGSLFGPEGTAIVIHADPDDEKTDPSGNSGDRIACGVIQKGT